MPAIASVVRAAMQADPPTGRPFSRPVPNWVRLEYQENKLMKPVDFYPAPVRG